MAKRFVRPGTGLHRRRQNRALWIGGGVALAAAVVGGVVYAASKSPAAPATPPAPPTGTVTLDVAAGTSNAQVGSQQSLNLQLPTGATFTGLQVDSAAMASAVGQNAATLPTGLSVGAHSVYALWTDSTGAAQYSSISLNVTP